MCSGCGTHDEVAASIPREFGGGAVDPIELEPVDEVVITTLVDNSYAALMADHGVAHRIPIARTPEVASRQFVEDTSVPGLIAEHGFSVRIGHLT